MNDKQVKEQLEKLKKGEYIFLSNWYGGKNESGYSGYLVDFDDNTIYEFNSVGTYTDTFISEAYIKKLLRFLWKSKLFLNYI